jgi:hypothetical protein
MRTSHPLGVKLLQLPSEGFGPSSGNDVVSENVNDTVIRASEIISWMR